MKISLKFKSEGTEISVELEFNPEIEGVFLTELLNKIIDNLLKGDSNDFLNFLHKSKDDWK